MYYSEGFVIVMFQFALLASGSVLRVKIRFARGCGAPLLRAEVQCCIRVWHAEYTDLFCACRLVEGLIIERTWSVIGVSHSLHVAPASFTSSRGFPTLRYLEYIPYISRNGIPFMISRTIPWVVKGERGLDNRDSFPKVSRSKDIPYGNLR